jgi:UDP-N-acetylglucosamine--N-acetylmuramyl-(pentapeptide) pyrophosphoryl-undecaprenol N-acetylglucosamine transferase
MRALISGGGTGGHLFPAIAVAQALLRSDPETQVLYVGLRGGMEEQVVPRYGIPFATISAVKLDMEAPWANWRVPLVLPRALWQARGLVARFHPGVVLGTGGYVSAPLLVTAAAMGIPIVLQEQNYLPGRATRLLARVARVIATAYEESAGYLEGRQTVVTGTPVRPEFQTPRTDFPDRPRRVLVVGGSQGAHRINLALADAVPVLLERPGLEVAHQTGVRDLEAMQAAKAALPAGARERYHPFAFADDLPARLQAADLVLSRAGASTLSETSALGIPMILVPGPFARGHQRLNAEPFAQAGAATIIADDECDGPRVVREILSLVDDPVRYRGMIGAMRRKGRPGAADDVARILRRVARD